MNDLSDKTIMILIASNILLITFSTPQSFQSFSELIVFITGNSRSDRQMLAANEVNMLEGSCQDDTEARMEVGGGEERMLQNEPGGGDNRLVSVEESSGQADSVRQVLDDVEAHIERLRAEAARLGRERAAALDTLEGIRASLAASPGMSGLDRHCASASNTGTFTSELQIAIGTTHHEHNRCSCT